MVTSRIVGEPERHHRRREFPAGSHSCFLPATLPGPVYVAQSQDLAGGSSRGLEDLWFPTMKGFLSAPTASNRRIIVRKDIETIGLPPARSVLTACERSQLSHDLDVIVKSLACISCDPGGPCVSILLKTRRMAYSPGKIQPWTRGCFMELTGDREIASDPAHLDSVSLGNGQSRCCRTRGERRGRTPKISVVESRNQRRLVAEGKLIAPWATETGEGMRKSKSGSQ